VPDVPVLAVAAVAEAEVGPGGAEDAINLIINLRLSRERVQPALRRVLVVWLTRTNQERVLRAFRDYLKANPPVHRPAV
jgi:hypothetical protein